MRVKWSRNLDVPAQQRGQTSTRDSNRDDKRKGFLHIFKFRDRKNEDDRKKGNATQVQPPKESNEEGKIRKTVTFADQQSPGTSVVCNRKGRRVSTDAVDMTVFKVSKNESLNKPQSSRTAIERSPLFKRTESDSASERKHFDVKNETEKKSPNITTVTVEKPTSSHSLTSVGNASGAPSRRTFETEVRSLSDVRKSARNTELTSRTSEKSDTCNDEEQKNASKIPVLVSKESFCVAKDVFKSGFWSNNIEIAAKVQTPSSFKLGLENDHIISDRGNGVRKDSFQAINKKEEKTLGEMLRSKIPVSESSVSCKESKIKDDKNVNEKSHHQICLGEAAIPHNLSRENNKHASTKTVVYSPVGYCGSSKLVLPKVLVNDNASPPSSYGASNFQKDARVQNIGTKRFESKESSSCQNKLLSKNDPTTDKGDVKPKAAVSTQETMSENKSDCPTRFKNGFASNEVVESDGIVSAPVESGEVTSPPRVQMVKTGDFPSETTEEKPFLNSGISENEGGIITAPSVEDEQPKRSITKLGTADKSTGDDGKKEDDTEIEKNKAIVSDKAMSGVAIENRDKEIAAKDNNPSKLCLQPNSNFRCLSEILLTKGVKDKILVASNAPVPVKSGIENMRNLLDASIIIVNHRELSSKPWICNIFTRPEQKRPCWLQNRPFCDKDVNPSRIAKDAFVKLDKTNEANPVSVEGEINIGDIVFIHQNNIFAESKRPVINALEMPSYAKDTSFPVESGEIIDTDKKGEIAGQEGAPQMTKFINLDSSKGTEQDIIVKPIEYDNVAFIDEQVDDEVSSNCDEETQSDFSQVPVLSAATISNSNDNTVSSQGIPETDFKCKNVASKSTACNQQNFPEICSAEILADDLGEVKVSEFEEPSGALVSCPQDSFDAGVNVTAIEDLPTLSADVEEACQSTVDFSDRIPSEEASSENIENRSHSVGVCCPSSPIENALKESTSVKVGGDDLQHTSNASEVNCNAIPLKKYDSIEFIDDITDEESNSERASVGEREVSSGMSYSVDGQEDVPSKAKEPREDTSQSGDILKNKPKTSQSPGVGKYGGSTQMQAPPVWSTRVELQQEIQRLGTLCEARTKELNHMKMNFRHASLGFDAFVAMFQYLTEELDAFSQPRLVVELEKTCATLEEAEAHLHQYQKEFEEMKAKHSEELCKLEKELNQSHQETIENLNLNHTAEIEELRQYHDKQLADLAETHKKQCQEMEEKHSAALFELKNEHSLQLEELKIFHADQLEAIENSHHETRVELNNQLKELEQQCKDLKHQAKLVEEALQRDTDTKIQWISAKKADLEKEVDSLKAVLDMRRTEIHTLRKENLEMKKELEKLPIAKEKIKMLEAKAEDLQALVNEKIQIERQLSSDHQNLKESYEKESKVNVRLSMENEELMWKLKQNYEANLLLSSFAGTPDAAEKSPLKSPGRQSVSLPMFFHNIENNATDSDKMSLPVSSSNITPCKKLPPLARKCSSPIRTPSFVAASPPGPCSRKCKMDLKAVISPRKQKHKSHSSEKKFPSKEADSTHNPHPSDPDLPQHFQLHPSEDYVCIKDSSPSSINGISSDGSQPDCLAEMDHNGVLFGDAVDPSNGSSNEDICSRELEYSDNSLDFEHYDMLITNQMLSKKYNELTHLKKGTEIMHELDDSQHDTFVSCSADDDNHSLANSQNMMSATEENTSSKDFMFDEKHFAEIQPHECPSLPRHSSHKKSDSWTISPFYSHSGEPAASTLSHSGCDNSPQSYLQPENSSFSTGIHSQATPPSRGKNCSHPLQSSLSQEKQHCSKK